MKSNLESASPRFEIGSVRTTAQPWGFHSAKWSPAACLGERLWIAARHTKPLWISSGLPPPKQAEMKPASPAEGLRGDKKKDQMIVFLDCPNSR